MVDYTQRSKWAKIRTRNGDSASINKQLAPFAIEATLTNGGQKWREAGLGCNEESECGGNHLDAIRRLLERFAATRAAATK